MGGGFTADDRRRFPRLPLWVSRAPHPRRAQFRRKEIKCARSPLSCFNNLVYAPVFYHKTMNAASSPDGTAGGGAPRFFKTRVMTKHSPVVAGLSMQALAAKTLPGQVRVGKHLKHRALPPGPPPGIVGET